MAQQDLTNVCRVCLQSDIVKKKKGFSLFQKYKDSLISELINCIANVEIKENDGLPSKICPGCLIELEVAVNFRLKCQTSNTILHKKIDNSESENYDVKVEYNLDDIKEEKSEEELPITVETEYIEDDFIDDTGVTVKTEGKPSRAVDLKLICDDCGGSFPSKCKLSVHWKKVHMCQNLICQICKRVFKSYQAFHRHAKLKQKTCLDMGNVNIEGLGKTRRYCCKECPYTSKRTKDMQTHLVLHSGEKPFKCSSCDTYFTQQSSKQDHMERVHGEYRKEITCQYCGKFVRGRAAAYKHLRWHTLVRVQCDVCKKFFKNKRVLKAHMVRHTGVKSFACEKCAKLFYTLSELCNHRRTLHSNLDIWYKCPLCEYKAHKSSCVKKHQAKHSETNISCPVCGMFFESAEKLLHHQQRHSESRKKFECPHCDKKFLRKDSLPKHIRTKHKYSMFLNKPVLVKSEKSQDKDGSIEVTETKVQIKTLRI